ncbi:UNVERIFIED_CONTAM: hypothetical protein GTU68_026046 [Idotea baltica]|nr:hypothetical protein [Idotea baltica]
MPLLVMQVGIRLNIRIF